MMRDGDVDGLWHLLEAGQKSVPSGFLLRCYGVLILNITTQECDFHEPCAMARRPLSAVSKPRDGP